MGYNFTTNLLMNETTGIKSWNRNIQETLSFGIDSFCLGHYYHSLCDCLLALLSIAIAGTLCTLL
jgi:hypothetical protein